MTLVLLASAGLLLNGFVRLSRVDHGFDPEHLLQVYVQLPEWRYPTDVEMRVALERLRSETARLPEVASVTIASSIPPNLNFAPARDLGVSDSATRVLEGYVAFGRVDDAFFATLGIPVLSGRAFEPADRPDSQPVAVVSRALARRLWPDGDAVGRRFRESAEAPWLTVVGIVGDVSNGVFERPIGKLAYYTPRTQAPPWWYEGVVVRTRADPARAVASLRAIVHRVLPDAPIVQVVTAYDTIAGANARVRFATFLMSAFAALALAVALIGVYGTFWCAVRQRTREIGVRIALGATQGHVLRSVLGASARLTLAGIAAGLAFVSVAARALQSLLFEVSPTDTGTLMAVAAFLAVSATAATYLPARHAARIDPVDVLRQD